MGFICLAFSSSGASTFFFFQAKMLESLLEMLEPFLRRRVISGTADDLVKDLLL